MHGVLIPADPSKPLRVCTKQELIDEYEQHPLHGQYGREIIEPDVSTDWTCTSQTWLREVCNHPHTNDKVPNSVVTGWHMEFDDSCSLKAGLSFNQRATQLAHAGQHEHREHHFMVRGDAFVFVHVRFSTPNDNMRSCNLRVPVNIVEQLVAGRAADANAQLTHDMCIAHGTNTGS